MNTSTIFLVALVSIGSVITFTTLIEPIIRNNDIYESMKRKMDELEKEETKKTLEFEILQKNMKETDWKMSGENKELQLSLIKMSDELQKTKEELALVKQQLNETINTMNVNHSKLKRMITMNGWETSRNNDLDFMERAFQSVLIFLGFVTAGMNIYIPIVFYKEKIHSDRFVRMMSKTPV